MYQHHLVCSNVLQLNLQSLESSFPDIYSKMKSHCCSSSHDSDKYFRIVICDFLWFKIMEILHSIRQKLDLFGYISGERMFRFNFLHHITSLLIFLVLISQASATGTYMISHLLMGDVKSSTYTGFQMSAVTQLTASFISILCKKKRVREVVDAFQKIFNACNDKSLGLVSTLSIEYILICANTFYRRR